MKYLIQLFLLGFFVMDLGAARKKPQEWIKDISQLIPVKATVAVSKKKKVLVFSLATGYRHYVIPYVDEVMKAMAVKTAAFDVKISYDIEDFSNEKLSQFDAIILNNTCSIGPQRNLFRDVLVTKLDKFGNKYKNLSLKEREEKARQFEANLLNFVQDGKGLMVLHGAMNMLNNSPQVSEMTGGSFDYHPPFQAIQIKLVEPGHPLLKAFKSKDFVYKDEPYIFKNDYGKMDFRPLLQMDTSKLTRIKPSVKSMARYMAWIKRSGKGRVFVSSPSHSHLSYENPAMLKFYLDGLQYVLGDLKCDDSVKKY
ncbi:MAG: ThuA domain-containing protein [Lentisphaeraceae bacterium]|nr:ThuA domain-containing protein [Lentisphaeraceae bacterium]